MTYYVGETFTVTVVASDFGEDARDLTSGDITAMWIRIFDKAGNALPVVDGATPVYETMMTYNAEKLWWEYVWDTTDLDPGGYKIRCRLEDLYGRDSWEWKNFRLSKNPVSGV